MAVGAGLLAWPIAAGAGPDPSPSAPVDPPALAGSTTSRPSTLAVPPAPPVSAAPSAQPAPLADPADGTGRAGVQQVGVTYADAGVVQAFHGRGSATAVLDGDLLPPDGGRLSVVLSPSETALIGWQVHRFVPADGASDQLLAARSVTERRGVAVPIVFPVVGGPPTTVRVQAPAGVAWSLVVTALRGASPR